MQEFTRSKIVPHLEIASHGNWTENTVVDTLEKTSSLKERDMLNKRENKRFNSLYRSEDPAPLKVDQGCEEHQQQ